MHYRFVSSNENTQLHGAEPIANHRVRLRIQLSESDYALTIHLRRFASKLGVMHFSTVNILRNITSIGNQRKFVSCKVSGQDVYFPTTRTGTRVEGSTQLRTVDFVLNSRPHYTVFNLGYSMVSSYLSHYAPFRVDSWLVHLLWFWGLLLSLLRPLSNKANTTGGLRS